MTVPDRLRLTALGIVALIALTMTAVRRDAAGGNRQ